ncbi:hypothetical protein F4677DRAFT_66893 [Hypoxylon crocopeplum]|nr:hypothetical protein F4677DRAFT_66893 [Hypoxylon crocopeplum]
MAGQEKVTGHAASSTPSNGEQPITTGINQSLFEPYIVDMDDSYYGEDKKDPDPQTTDSYNYRYGDNGFYFSELDELIEDHTAVPAATIKITKPYNRCSSRAVHNQQQISIWKRIRQEAEDNDSIPNALFVPPRTFVQVRVSVWPISSHYCCPCDIDEENCHVIEIRAPEGSEDGITKDMFIRQVSRAMYGPDPQEPDDHSSYTIGGEDDRPVIERFDYMLADGLMGHIFAMTRGISQVETERT